ncbi:hypothetical protein HYU94_01955 [Candidatus Daviesbacteria bacterium]|nr:hypothetical protein [Candidatus Daviesbacteria bacterium]
MKLDPLEDKIEEWEKGLTPVQRFEKLVQYGQVTRLVKNPFFQSLDKAGQVGALSDALGHLIHQLDQMSLTLMKVSSTHPEGVKINRMAVALTQARKKLLSDFAQGIDIVDQISSKSKGERYF